MNGKYILDANVIIDVFRGHIPTIERLEKLTHTYIPVIVLGELYYGANKSNRTQKRIEQIEALEQVVTILYTTENTAMLYGTIKNQLKENGTPIPENDIWIAAIAMEVNLPLLSNDKHFDLIEGLIVEKSP